MSTDERLRQFAEGKLSGAELEAFERELDASPPLRAALAALVTRPVRAPLFEHEPTVRTEGLSVRRVLGRGGMATVLLATQHGLEREVAVKISRQQGDAEARQQLLREARLTGALEHPAIVPVHAITHSDEGELQIVLKRVEGEPWSVLKADRATILARFGADLLEWNLRVLETICGAVAFAHERGVVHRDIKPANVMIGRFGEVLLMDWGLGGLLTEDPTGHLPHVTAGDGAGTPTYQAPETLAGAPGPLSARTDVYLLGGVLYELLYGRPPFATASRRTLTGEPDFPQSEHPELAALSRKALSADPSKRHASALEFLRDLEAFHRNQHVSRVVRRAQQLLDRSRAQRREQKDAASRSSAEAASVLRAALDLAPDHPPALEIARELVTFQVECALEDGHPALAAQALEASPRPMPELDERVKRAVAEHRALHDFARSLDPKVGRTHRLRFLVALVLVTAGFYTVRLNFPALYQGKWALALSSVAFIVTIGVMSFAFRGLLAGSKLNRQLMALAALVNLGQLLLRVSAAALEIPRAQAIAFELPLIAIALATAAIIHHWTFAIGSLLLVAGQVLTLFFPANAERFFTGAMLGTLVALGIAWRSGAWASVSKEAPDER